MVLWPAWLGGPPCHCGGAGCLEALASGRAIARRYGVAPEQLSDPDAWVEIGRWIGLATVNVTAVHDPDVVIFGGGVCASWARFSPSLHRDRPTLPASPALAGDRPRHPGRGSIAARRPAHRRGQRRGPGETADGAVGYGAMPSVHLVCDSTADLDPAFRAAHSVRVIPLKVIFGDQTFADGVDITAEDVLRAAGGPRALPANLTADAGRVRGRLPGARRRRRLDRLHHHLRRSQRHLRIGDPGARGAARSGHPRHRHTQRGGRPLRGRPRGGASDRVRRGRRQRGGRHRGGREHRQGALHRRDPRVPAPRRAHRRGACTARLGARHQADPRDPRRGHRGGGTGPDVSARDRPRRRGMQAGGGGLGRRRAGDRPRRPARRSPPSSSNGCDRWSRASPP